MKMLLCAVAAIASAAPGVSADVISVFNFDTQVVGGRNLSFVPVPDLSLSPAGPGAFSTSGDLWGVINESINDDVLDNSLHDPTDMFGVLIENFDGMAFASEDLQNPDNPGGTASATWTFDISGYTNVTVSIRAAAMGNFETAGCVPGPCFPDQYVFRASINGGAPVTIFTAVADETAAQTYTLQSGTQVALNDPLRMNGMILSNVFQTITSAGLGGGSVLTLTLAGQCESSEEVFIFDDIVVSGTPVPPCPADFNGVGGVTVADIFAFLSAWFASGPGADFNGVGGITVADIFAFLSAWFAGC